MFLFQPPLFLKFWNFYLIYFSDGYNTFLFLKYGLKLKQIRKGHNYQQLTLLNKTLKNSRLFLIKGLKNILLGMLGSVNIYLIVNNVAPVASCGHVGVQHICFPIQINIRTSLAEQFAINFPFELSSMCFGYLPIRSSSLTVIFQRGI